MAFPLTDKITNLNFYSDQPTLISTSLSGREQRAQASTQKWRVDITMNALSDADRRKLQAYFAEQGGALNAFDFQLPQELADSSAGYTGNITVSGAHTAGDTTIDIQTSGNGITVLKAGDLLRFNGAVKTYMVVSDVLVDGSGAGTVTISPALQTNLTNTQAVAHQNVNLNMRLDGDTFNYAIGQDFYSNIKLKLIEVI